MRRICQFVATLLGFALASSMALGGDTLLPRCGLLIDPSLRGSAAAALFEATFAQDSGIIAIDRSEIDKVLHEQQVQAMFGADAVGRRTACGKIIKADLLVLIRQVQPPVSAQPDPQEAAPTPALEIVVCETRRGLRLLAETISAGEAPATDARQLAAAFHRALARSQEPLDTIVAVPPFASRNLTHDLDYLQDVYAWLVQEVLSSQPGVLVVEIPEAKALADEVALAGGEQVQRKLPFYLMGKFRHEGIGADLHLSLTLDLTRGVKKLDNATFDRLAPDAVPETLRSATLRLLKTTGNSPAVPARADVALESAELADKADAFARVGAWHEARVLAEASLLLDPQNVQMHGVAYQALNGLAIQIGGNPGAVKDAAKGLACFHESLAHLELYIAGKQFKNITPGPLEDFRLDGFWRAIRWELLDKADPSPQRWIDADREANETVWRALHRKSAARVDDCTVERFFALLGPPFHVPSKFSPPPDWTEVAATINTMRSLRLSLLKEFSYRHHANGFFHLMLEGRPEETADPQWQVYLDEAAKIPNPEIAQVLAEIRIQDSRNIAQLHAQGNGVPSPTTHAIAPEDAEVTFEKLQFQGPAGIPGVDITKRIIGCMSGADGIDIYWTPNLIFTMTQKGVLGEPSLGPFPPWPKDESDASNAGPSEIWLTPKGACFDGQYAWFIITAAPAASQPHDTSNQIPPGKPLSYAVIAIDVKRSKIIWLGKKQGLPPGAAAITGLTPGKVCVGGDFGRSWCAVASVSPDLDGGVPLKVIYEAREVLPETPPRRQLARQHRQGISDSRTARFGFRVPPAFDRTGDGNGNGDNQDSSAARFGPASRPAVFPARPEHWHD